MARTPVKPPALEPLAGGRPPPRYSTLALHLTREIESGRYKVGQKIPTEAELQQRHDVSRHTVREALRELKARGLVTARAGIGTVVRAKGPRTQFVQGAGTLKDIIQFVEATRMHVERRRVVVADEALAERVGVKPGQECHEVTLLRYAAQGGLPVALIRNYVRPEHADVIDRIDAAQQPVFSLIERHHGVRVVEVRQQIVAVALEPAMSRMLRARPGAPALRITRQFLDAHDRLLMASEGTYPGDRFTHTTQFRIDPAETQESR
jgi:DNA-binding GntR family transcriptional regulator